MKQMLRLRTGAVVILIILITALIAAACGEEATPAPAAVLQELVVGAPTDTYRTDGERATLGMYPVNTGIYDNLVRVYADYQIEPVLATSWEFVAPNTWRFKLRQGVTFQDGQKFTSQAVKLQWIGLLRLAVELLVLVLTQPKLLMITRLKSLPAVLIYDLSNKLLTLTIV